MTPSTFVADVAQQLRLMGRDFDPVALRAFVESCWPAIEEDPAASHSAREFIAAQQGAFHHAAP